MGHNQLVCCLDSIVYAVLAGVPGTAYLIWSGMRDAEREEEAARQAEEQSEESQGEQS
jgi:threonine/homoserine/homoserine lactone efflux protein